MVAEPPRVRTVNRVGLELRAHCTLQRTQNFSGCQLLCMFLAHDFSVCFVFSALHCALTVVRLWHLMVNKSPPLYVFLDLLQSYTIHTTLGPKTHFNVLLPSSSASFGLTFSERFLQHNCICIPHFHHFNSVSGYSCRPAKCNRRPL